MSLSESFNQIPLMNKIIGGAAALIGIAGIGAVLATGGGVGFVVVILAILLLCVAVWFAFLLIANQLKAKRAREMEEDLVSGAGVDMGGAEADERAMDDELREKWLEGYNRFKKYGLDVYEIPWLMMVGPPGCGKTTLLKKSQVVDPDECPGPGGTLGMNWMFTDQAVFLDLAGAVFMEQRKAGRWEKFLDFLGKHRENCPINGAILAVSFDNLSDDPETVHELATAVKRQLERLRDKLDVRFPVWVVVTKCDKIPGFREFFADADSLSGGKQMLGWSKPGDVDDLDESFVPSELDDHLDTVFAQLRRMRMRKMRAMVGGDETGQRQSDRVDELFGLPDEMRKLTPALRRYLELIFINRKGRGAPPFLRGVYFSSSEQKGAALSEAAKRLGVKPRPSMMKDKAFFLYDLLKSKVFCEVGLVTRSNNVGAANRKKKILRYGIGTAAAVLITLILLVGFWSFTRATSPGAHLQALSEAVTKDQKPPVEDVLRMWEEKSGAAPKYAGADSVGGPTKFEILSELRKGAEASSAGFSPWMLLAFWQTHEGLKPATPDKRRDLYVKIAARTLIQPMVKRAEERVLLKDPTNWLEAKGEKLDGMDRQLAALIQLATPASKPASKVDAARASGKEGSKDGAASDANPPTAFNWRNLDPRYLPLAAGKVADAKASADLTKEMSDLSALLDVKEMPGPGVQIPPMASFLSPEAIRTELTARDIDLLGVGLDGFIKSVEEELKNPSGDFGTIFSAMAAMKGAEDELKEINSGEKKIKDRAQFIAGRKTALALIETWDKELKILSKDKDDKVEISSGISGAEKAFIVRLKSRIALVRGQLQSVDRIGGTQLTRQQKTLDDWAVEGAIERDFANQAANGRLKSTVSESITARLNAKSGIARLKRILTAEELNGQSTFTERADAFTSFTLAKLFPQASATSAATGGFEKIADDWFTLSKQYLLVTAVRGLAEDLKKPTADGQKPASSGSGAAGATPAPKGLVDGVRFPDAAADQAILVDLAMAYGKIRSIENDRKSLEEVPIEPDGIKADAESVPKVLKKRIEEQAKRVASFATKGSDIRDFAKFEDFEAVIGSVKDDTRTVQNSVDLPLKAMISVLRSTPDQAFVQAVENLLPNKWPDDAQLVAFRDGWKPILGAFKLNGGDMIAAVQEPLADPIKFDETIPYLGPLSAKLTKWATDRIKQERDSLGDEARTFNKFPLFEGNADNALSAAQAETAAIMFGKLAAASRPRDLRSKAAQALLADGVAGKADKLQAISQWSKEISEFMKAGEITIEPCPRDKYTSPNPNVEYPPFDYWSFFNRPAKPQLPRNDAQRDPKERTLKLEMIQSGTWAGQKFNLYPSVDSPRLRESGPVLLWTPLQVVFASERGARAVRLPNDPDFLVYATVTKGTLTGKPLKLEDLNAALGSN